MVKSLEQINEEFRNQKKKKRKKISKITPLVADFTAVEQAPAEPVAVANVTADEPIEEISADEQAPEPAEALEDAPEVEDEVLTDVEPEPLPEGVVLQELELSLLYGSELAAEMELEDSLKPEPESLVGRELYRPRSLSEIEHEFKEKVGRGRRENAPKTVHHRRIASGISSLIYYLLTILLVVTAWVYAQNGRLFLGEYKMHSVLSGSMESVYPQGSLFFTKEVDVQELVVGNDIAFHRDATSTIVHRIVQIYEVSHESGQRLFITKGVNNEREDDAPVPAGNVVGKVVFFIPHIGKLFKNINNNFNYIVIFFVAGILFSFFLNMTIGETNRERRIRKAKKILKEDIKQVV